MGEESLYLRAVSGGNRLACRVGSLLGLSQPGHEALHLIGLARTMGACELGVDRTTRRLEGVTNRVLILTKLCSLAHRRAVLASGHRCWRRGTHGRLDRAWLGWRGADPAVEGEPPGQGLGNIVVLMSSADVVVRRGGSCECRQVSDHRRGLGASPGRVQDPKALVELVHRQPTLCCVLAEHA